jgi:colanic acid/amylovoran biosynthesis glycosyltransferase
MSGGGTVAIWRSCLLPASETFVRNHGDALTVWRPSYVGAVKVPSSLARDTDLISYRGRFGFLLLRATGGSSQLRRLLAGVRPDVVHAHFAGDGWLISRTAARLGIPLVITVHGRDVTTQSATAGPRGARYRRNLRTAFDRASAVLAVSESIRERVVALGADPSKVRVHYTGVPVPASVPVVPKRWDVVFVGRFVAKKGVDDLVEAVGSLRDRRPRVAFIGDGPLMDPMRRRAAELGVDATFLGRQPSSAVAHCLAQARLLAAPSKTAPDGDAEGLPTTILEAAGVGVPAVATYHSGIPEAVVSEETGLLCAEGDRSALAVNIARLLADDALRTRYGQAARARVSAHFDLAKQTARLEELYSSLAGRVSALSS